VIPPAAAAMKRILCASALLGMFLPGSGLAVEVEGTALPFQRVVVSSPIEEVVDLMNVREGESVKAGHLLARLSNRRERLQVERLDALLQKARFDFESVQRLFERQIESREALLEKEAELKRLEAERGIALFEAEQREIKSPIDGVVVRCFKESGESVGRVEPIVEVIDASRLLLLFHLDSRFQGRVAPGEAIPVAFPEAVGGAAEATVHFIDPEVDAKSGLFRVRLLLPNPEGRLKPGLRVTARFPDGA
jgi:membrane fusion protein, multidrug efflux system